MDIERLKQRKKELGWTHDELAERSGISRTTIARMFSGNPDYPSPTYNTVEAVAKAMGLSDGGGDFPILSDEEKNLVALYRSAPKEGKDAVLRLLQSYQQKK